MKARDLTRPDQEDIEAKKGPADISTENGRRHVSQVSRICVKKDL